MSAPENNTDEIAELRRLLAEKEQRIASYDTELAQRNNRIAQLEEQNAILRKQIFGSKSEKLTTEDAAQALLFNEAERHTAPEDTRIGTSVKAHSRKKAGRKPIPENLQRKEIIHDLSEDQKQCSCGTSLSHIGDDIAEELDIIPQQVIVNRHVRRKYACRSCEGVSDETQPAVKTASHARMLPGTIAAPGLLAYLLVSKFADALPFYRQERMFESLGVHINRATMCAWAIAVARRLEPLRAAFLEAVRDGPLLAIDETTVQVLKESGRAPQTKSYMWVLRGGGPDRPLVLFEYRPSRSGTVLLNCLAISRAWC